MVMHREGVQLVEDEKRLSTALDNYIDDFSRSFEFGHTHQTVISLTI